MCVRAVYWGKCTVCKNWVRTTICAVGTAICSFLRLRSFAEVLRDALKRTVTASVNLSKLLDFPELEQLLLHLGGSVEEDLV